MLNLAKIWAGFMELLPRLISGFKTLLFYIFIRKSTKNEIENKQLKKQNHVQQQQLKTAAAPPSSWERILELMRLGKR